MMMCTITISLPPASTADKIPFHSAQHGSHDESVLNDHYSTRPVSYVTRYTVENDYLQAVGA